MPSRRVLIALALAFALSTFVCWRLTPKQCPPDTLYTAPFTNAETGELIGLLCGGSKEG